MSRPVVRHLSSVVAILTAVALGGSWGPANAASLAFSSQPLTPYRTCVLSGTPTTTTVVADAEVRQATAGTNYGTATTLVVTSSGTANRRIYLRFDLAACVPAIPSTATVRLATLRLYASALPAACRTLDVFRLTTAWTEAAITWTNQPSGTVLNTPPLATRSDSFDVGTPVGCLNRTAGVYVTGVDLTADVASFVSGASTNLGWMIRDDVEGSATARTVTFSAKNLGTPAQAPQLIVTYVVVP